MEVTGGSENSQQAPVTNEKKDMDASDPSQTGQVVESEHSQKTQNQRQF
jgi:hypothetical protein